MCVDARVCAGEEENGARGTEKGEKREHVVVIWLFYCLALVVKVLGRGYTRSGSCQKPPESGYPDRPYTDREYSAGVVGAGGRAKQESEGWESEVVDLSGANSALFKNVISDCLFSVCT